MLAELLIVTLICSNFCNIIFFSSRGAVRAVYRLFTTPICFFSAAITLLIDFAHIFRLVYDFGVHRGRGGAIYGPVLRPCHPPRSRTSPLRAHTRTKTHANTNPSGQLVSKPSGLPTPGHMRCVTTRRILSRVRSNRGKARKKVIPGAGHLQQALASCCLWVLCLRYTPEPEDLPRSTP